MLQCVRTLRFVSFDLRLLQASWIEADPKAPMARLPSVSVLIKASLAAMTASAKVLEVQSGFSRHSVTMRVRSFAAMARFTAVGRLKGKELEGGDTHIRGGK